MRSTIHRASLCLLAVLLLESGCAVCPLGTPPAARAPIPGATRVLSWGKPQLLFSGPSLVWAYTRVAAGPPGSAFILFSHATTGTEPPISAALYASRYLAATDTWAPEQLLQSQPGLLLQSNLAADEQGNAMVVWLQQTPAGNTFFSSRFSAATGQWSAALQLTFPVDDTPTMRLVMSPVGDALFVWTTLCKTLCRPAEHRVMAMRYSAANDRWIQPPVPLNSARDTVSYWPAAALDANGNALVQWQQADSRNIPVIRGTGFNADKLQWCSDATLSRTNYGQATTPAIAMDASGNALAVWTQRFATLTGDEMQGIDARRYDRASNDWQPAARIDSHIPDYGGMFNPSMVVATNTGDALAGWLYIPHPPPLTGAAEGRVYSAAKQDWDIRPRFDHSTDPNNPRLGGTVLGGFPVLASDPAGDQVAFWAQSDKTAWASYRYPPGLFRAPQQLQSAPGAAVDAITGAIELGGNATAVWVETTVEGQTLWVSRAR
ncbi:hypothetical protein JY651_43410 [Pyxidicoccus parkwayensis]|uniref:Lipoprotein n=1 Tax=Pyxidicoccus parkwayensis TaxID=2813578 RepID=A0ABX7NSR6_9BACT|nr:hypothetical protein [Pyxidicoccus parkwaysis]QSQ21926.1 hypothetical protein JY651_43410 [Pyxidicoccus parkwaysis]